MKIEKHKLGREKKGVIQNSIYWFVGLKLACRSVWVELYSR